MRAIIKIGIIIALLCGADEVRAIEWGKCQQTESSKLRPDIVIPVNSTRL